jgi:hypothetical protein
VPLRKGHEGLESGGPSGGGSRHPRLHHDGADVGAFFVRAVRLGDGGAAVPQVGHERHHYAKHAAARAQKYVGQKPKPLEDRQRADHHRYRAAHYSHHGGSSEGALPLWKGQDALKSNGPWQHRTLPFLCEDTASSPQACRRSL